jgi:hypothetical protein
VRITSGFGGGEFEVKEYSIPPLADDNEDAVKLRAAINMATRKHAKPYERSNSTFTTGRGFFRRQPATSNQQKATMQPDSNNSFIAVVTNTLCFIADALFFNKTGVVCVP